jgi:Right handed beta helix region
MTIHSYNTNVIFNNLHHNGDGIWYGHHCYNPAIYGNITANNTGYGINLSDHNAGAYIAENTTSGNGQVGISVTNGGTPGAVVSNNTASGNTTCGYSITDLSNFIVNAG